MEVEHGKKILICGDRDWDDRTTMGWFINSLQQNTIIVNGGAEGADKMSTDLAILFGFEYKEYYADWETFGDSAGPRRNKEMLEDNRDLDLVVAFHNDILNSKGTADMVKRAKDRGVEVRLITSNEYSRKELYGINTVVVVMNQSNQIEVIYTGDNIKVAKKKFNEDYPEEGVDVDDFDFDVVDVKSVY